MDSLHLIIICSQIRNVSDLLVPIDEKTVGRSLMPSKLDNHNIVGRKACRMKPLIRNKYLYTLRKRGRQAGVPKFIRRLVKGEFYFQSRKCMLHKKFTF